MLHVVLFLMMKMTGMKKSADFSRVYHEGKSRADRNLVLYAAERGDGDGLFGVSVSKKVGNSVVRHRIKRRLKEIVRLNSERFPKGYDLVVIARMHAASSDYAGLEHSMLKLAVALLPEKEETCLRES